MKELMQHLIDNFEPVEKVQILSDTNISINPYFDELIEEGFAIEESINIIDKEL